MFALPLQAIDDFLLQYNIGHVLVLMFVLGLLGTLPLRSKTITGLHLGAFGLLFLITPLSLLGGQVVLKLVGIGLIFLGPMVIVVGK
ncbi:hypothetical protein [Halocatena pleomorpha]|uniref:DUF8006 domain-containing protein n=1 Tax=Halocatena pleomorpha TaxID=1785090 RepID=A0A3P3RF11_9EURY|nr:hypothetical protein [Halocatena pleomorpha]RRJ31003.1 hypothetical protein EIK79_08305 [Halocatena pleomorpha]